MSYSRTKLLSVIIPVYNEEECIGTLLRKLLELGLQSQGFEIELLVIDDCSEDKTVEIVRKFSNVKLFLQEKNRGKGAAVRRGLQECQGDWILIQDGDLEYDPNDYSKILEALTNSNMSVYGSRVLGQIEERGKVFPFVGKHPKQSIGPWVAAMLLTCWTFMLYGKWITDLLTAYKLYPADFIKNEKLETTGFETDHEITARLIRKGYKIVEVPIAYDPRSIKEGKKIKPIDGFIAMWTLLKYKFKKIA